jgi:hypothetical protein
MKNPTSVLDFFGATMSNRLNRGGAAAAIILCTAFSTGILALHTGCSTNPTDYADPAPSISAFTVSPTKIQAGSTAPITFKANFGVKDGSAVITPGNITVQSNVGVNVPPPSADTTYTLTVTSSAGKKATATVTVNVIGMTTSIDSLGKAIAGSTGLTASIPTAQGRTYKWTVTNGTLTSGDDTANQITFTAGTDTTKSVGLACNVVDPNPADAKNPITTTLGKSFQIFAPITFDKTIYSIKTGQSTPANYTVDSTVTGFTLTNLTAGALVGTKDTSTTKTGTFNLSPSVTSTYRAAVTGSTPTYTYQTDFQVVVSPSDPATISTFTATPNFLTIDAASLQTQAASTATSNLAWTLAGDPPTSLTLDGSNIAGTSTTVHPRNRQTYTLKSSNDGNPLGDTKTATVGVRGLDLLAGSMGGTGMRDGVGTLASFQRPQNMCVSGNFLYVADTNNHIIRKIDLTTKQVTTIAGIAGVSGTTDVSNGSPLTAKFNSPRGVTVDAQGYTWVADGGNNVLRVISPDSKYVYTVTGWVGTTIYTGSLTYGGPQNVVVNNDGTTCTAYVATSNGTLVQLNVTGLGSTTTAPAATIAKTFIVNGTTAGTTNSVSGCAMVMSGSTPVIFVPDSVAKKIKACYLDGSGNPQMADVTATLSAPAWSAPAAVAATISGSTATLFVADKHFVARYNVDLTTVPTSGPVLAAGAPITVGTATPGFADGTGDIATLAGPTGLAINGTSLYVAEGSYQWSTTPNIYTNTIRAIAAATSASANTGMTVSTLAGVNRAGVYSVKVPATGTSTGAAARFKTPGHVAIDVNGTSYLVDSGNARIVTVALDGTTANWPADATTWSTPLAAVPDSSTTPSVYVLESGAGSIKKFAPGSSTPTTISLITTTGTATTLGTSVKQAVYYKNGSNEYIYFVDGTTTKGLKRIDLATGTLATGYTTTAGSGLFGVAVAQDGTIYISEGSQISSLANFAATSVTAIAGNNSATYSIANAFIDGAGASAAFYQPGCLGYYYDAATTTGYLYVVDAKNCAIRKITLTGTNDVSTLIGRWNGLTVTSSSVPGSPSYSAALYGILPGTVEPASSADAATKALAGSITISTLTTQGLAVNPNSGDLVITTCDCLMQLTGPLNK